MRRAYFPLSLLHHFSSGFHLMSLTYMKQKEWGFLPPPPTINIFFNLLSSGQFLQNLPNLPPLSHLSPKHNLTFNTMINQLKPT